MQPAFIHHMKHFINRSINEYTYLIDLCYLPDFGSSHMFEYIPGTFWIKDHSRKSYSQLCQLIHLFRLCHAAYFNSHVLGFKCFVADKTIVVFSYIEMLSFSSLTNFLKAAPGSFSFIKFSPIRNPENPFFLNS